MKNAAKTKPLDPVAVCGSNDPAAVRELLTRIGDKWSIFLVLSLAKLLGGRARFSELQRAMPGISQRMLAITLRSLERDGLLTREVFPEVPPRVEYELTRLGKSLLHPMQSLVDWGTTNWDLVKKAQSRFDSKSGPARTAK
jgi:DNA-binding HxlR family transcriptional regulator